MTEQRPTFLIVDDDDRFRDRLAKALEARDYVVHAAQDNPSALALAEKQRIERAIVDLRMPAPGGLQLIRELIALQPAMEIVVLTGYGSIATAVEAMRVGARDYLTKPCHADRILAAFEAEPSPPREENPEYEIPSLARLEWEHIERVLRECNGNISKTARVLGMHRRTLQHKLSKFPVPR
ncbi:MAG TPA: response regulator [Polyangiaceae bacterium]|nr:response regulator [Polyangiaceae bacterium]